jgi:hypothetical protein
MPTLVQSRPKTEAVVPAVRYDVEPDDMEEADYPAEFFEEMDRCFEEAKSQIAAGELKPMSIAEFAAQHGIEFNG